MQGDGRQTRSFCHVDDLVRGVMVMRVKGEHLGIYHVGTTEEITIAELARRIAAHAGREIELIAARRRRAAPSGAAPTLASLGKLGYSPQVPLDAGPAANRRLVLGQRTACRAPDSLRGPIRIFGRLRCFQ
jgi:nucleoside-diphosphate-sugar epimerase